ncbi:tyrosine-type recombinase/integrase [Actinomadura chokoriensis]
MTAEAGISVGAISTKFSSTISTAFGYETSTSVSQLQSRSLTRRLTTPKGTAAGLWVGNHTFRVLRGGRLGRLKPVGPGCRKLPLLAIPATGTAVVAAAQGDSWPGSNIPGRRGRSVEPRNVNRAFESRCAAAGVEVICVHDTRHTCGKLLAALDVHPRVAMQILRHSKISLTMEIYTEVPSEQTRAALRRLGVHLGSGDESGEGST